MDDFEALNRWMDIHSRKIELFAIQYGLSFESAFRVTQDTFISFHKTFENMDEVESILPSLYKFAIEKMVQIQSIDPLFDDVFPFKEDAELHSEIINMDKKYRLPFILSSFHELDFEQIAAILQSSSTDVEVNIQTAKKILGEDHLEKRIGFLGKSYDRLPVLFKAEQIMGKTVPSEDKKEKFKPSKWLFIVSVLLISLLTATFFLANKGETEKIATSDFEIRYKEERNKRQEMLLLESDRFDKLKFIKEADRRMGSLLAKEATSLPENVEVEFQDILWEMKLPSEMIDDAMLGSTMMENEDESIRFLGSYRTKALEIISLYEGILWDYREDIESFEVERFINKADQMVISSDEFPEELKNILNTMENQSIQLISNQNTGRIGVVHYGSERFGEILFGFHPNVHGYIAMLVNEPYLNGGTMKSPIQEVFYYIFMMEEALAKVKKDKVLYPAMQAEYVSLFYNIVKGSAAEDVFDGQGIIKIDYKDVWQRYSNMFGVQPSNYLMMPIVEEMEASGWRSSNSWDEFSKEKILEVLELARTGELERLMYGERPVFEDDSITLPNEEFFSQVEQLYNEFKQSYDLHVLKGWSPLFTVGVYDYANEMEDPATMYHLLREGFDEYSETGMRQSLEEYVESWHKGFSIFKDFNRVEFIAANTQRMRHDFYASVDVHSNAGGRSFGIYLDEKENWFMQEVVHEQLPSSQIESEVAINDSFRSEIRHLHQSFSEHKELFMLEGQMASRIIGLYLYAGELRDYETQYALLYKGEDLGSVTKEEFLKQSENAPSYKMDDLFISISFNAEEQDENGNWPGVATLTDNHEEATIQSLQMMWKNKIWYVNYQNE